MNTILLILCNALSCFIISTILFQFMNGKYKKSSQSRYVYIVIETVTVIFTTCINMLNHSILNLVVWGVLTGIIAYALYYEDMDKPLRRIIECEALVFCMSVCESLGVILLQCILQAADIKNVNETMLYCLEVTFSKVILIFLYYTFINRFVKKSDIPYAKTRYIMYGIILLYNLINMGVIVENFKNGEENYLCAVNMGCIVLADLYLLYFVKMADEKNYYEKQLIALEQQAKVQYEYYLTQTKKYDQTVHILHDVNKHIKAIEGLYGAEQGNTAGEYAAEIRELLKPLIPVQYTENPILNILLTDKESVMREKGISVTIKVDNVNLNFLAPIDITTIFGNLLDNAIEAAEKLEGGKYISIKIGSYHKMIAASIENNCGEVKWKNGFPVSAKGKGGGIGLLNEGDNAKNIWTHAWICMHDADNEIVNSQANMTKANQYSLWHEVYETTGYDARNATYKNGTFIAEDGTDLLALFKEKSKNGAGYELYSKRWLQYAKNGWKKENDLVLKIGFDSSGLYDIGQEKGYGATQNMWMKGVSQSMFEARV